MSKRYEYPFTSQYVPDWRLKDALREFISNARDAEVQSGAEMKLFYDPAKQLARITSIGITVSHSSLLMGGSDKGSDSRLIGRHHEGMKMAMLVCARDHLSVRIRNGRSEIWEPSLEYSEKWGAKILMLDVRAANRQVENFDVEITGVSQELWDAVRALFLFLSPIVDRVVADNGELLLDPKFAGHVYVKGVYVDKTDMREGYNFTKLDLDRDRNVPPRWEMDNEVRDIWLHAARTQPAYAGRMYEAMDKNQPEASAFRYSSNDELIDALVAQFEGQHGIGSVPCASMDEAEGLKHYGERGVVVSADLVAKLQKRLRSPAKVRAEKRDSVTKRYQSEDLSEQEQRVLFGALMLIDRTGESHTEGRVGVVDFLATDILGLHQGETVLIARSELKSLGAALMVLIHEFAHDHGPDGSKGHIDSIQAMTTSVFDALAVS